MDKVLVSDVMTRQPITVTPSTNLLECARKMIRKRVKTILISDKGNLKGLITQRDILWALIKNPHSDLSKIKAIDISPKKLTILKPNENLETAVAKMNNRKFYRIPVVHKGKIVGLISSTDIIKFHPEIYPEFQEMHQIREESEKLKRIEQADERETVEDGVCEECGESGTLFRENDLLVCSACYGRW